MAGVSFTTENPAEVDENVHSGENPVHLVARLALAKARTVSQHHPHRWILGCDTVVALNERVLGKPRDPREARASLRALSGRRHRVLTGLAWIGPRGRVLGTSHVETRVEFGTIPEKELREYLSTSEPYDKAGGYGIQGTAGKWVRRLEGDYFNVVGLPVNRVLQDLYRFGALKNYPRR